MKILNSILVLLLVLAFAPVVHADDPVNRTERAEVRFLVGMIDHHYMALDMAQDCLVKATTEAVRTLCQNIMTNQWNEINEMRGWLLIWYGIDYRPMSMMHMMHQGGMMQGGMMQGGMMGGMMHGGMMQGGMMQATPMPGGPGHDQHHPGGQGGMMQGTPMPGGQGQGAGGMMGQGMMQGGMMDQSSYVLPMPMMGMMAGLHRLTGIEYEIAWLEAMIEHHQDALHMAERILATSERPELVELAERIIDDQTAEIQMMEEQISELSA